MNRHYMVFSGFALALALFLPCGLRSADLGPPAAVKVLPADVLDLGEFGQEETRSVMFRIRNEGKEPLSIRAVRAGCSCTAISQYRQTPIASGEEGTVTLLVYGRGLPEGTFERTAVVEFEGVPPVTLRFKGVLVRDIRITPGRDVDLGFFHSATADWRRTFEVRGKIQAGEELKLGTPETGGKVKVSLSKKDTSSYELAVTPKLPMASGPFREDIQIPVLEPKGRQPELIRLRAQVGQQLLVVPILVDIVPGDEPLERSLRVFFRYPDGELLTAAELSVTPPAGVTATAADAGQGKVTVTLTFSPAAREKGRKGIIELRTPQTTTVHVPYYVLSLPEKKGR